MRVIYRASDIVEAHIVAGMLEAGGIEAYVAGHYLQGGIGDLSPLGFANVLVGERDFDAAVAVVRVYEQGDGAPADQPAGDDPAGACEPG